MIRSQCAIIFGVWGAVWRMSISSEWKTASKDGRTCPRGRQREAHRAQPGAEVGGEIPGLLGGPVSGGVGVTSVMWSRLVACSREDEGVEAVAQGGVDVEEINRNDGVGLAGQEVPSGRATIVGGATRESPVWDVAPNSIIVAPSSSRPVGRSPGEIWGWCWGEHPITRLNISTDNGEFWTCAELDARNGHSWQRFSLSWTPLAVGEYCISSRATDERGHVQPEETRRKCTDV
jgi:hypothetical protein